RKKSGEADMNEVMAAMVLSSLSTSPLVRSPPGLSGPPGLSASFGSSSGIWSWDLPSDRSNPSTPSPPLPGDPIPAGAAVAFSDDGHDGHAAQSELLFEEPSPRKRKNSMKVMFKCMWPNCEKVLSTSSGIQRHIRTIHYSRNGDSDLSDGEEDFYYTEVEVSVESVTDGLSSLSAVSPTVCHLPSAVAPPHPHHRGDGRGVLPLSHSAPTAAAFWHVRADHAYQATPPLSVPVGESGRGVGMSLGSVSWQSPPFSSPVQTSITPLGQAGELAGAATPLRPTPRPTSMLRKIRGEGKKCRKVYGMENKDMWCTACRWKKACQRFLD
uniref:Zinc finger protein 704 n=1 Tax=Petromyzon marinus TaxID=7757 RepID=S4S070_PETMA